jgi:site-specific recombinase XerD
VRQSVSAACAGGLARRARRASGTTLRQDSAGCHIDQERLADQAIYHIEATRAADASVARFSPHDLRRTLAGDLLDAGVDLATVSRWWGTATRTSLLATTGAASEPSAIE